MRFVGGIRDHRRPEGGPRGHWPPPSPGYGAPFPPPPISKTIVNYYNPNRLQQTEHNLASSARSHATILRWPGRSPLERKTILKLSSERKAQSAQRRAQSTLWDGIGFRYVTVNSRDLLADQLIRIPHNCFHCCITIVKYLRFQIIQNLRNDRRVERTLFIDILYASLNYTIDAELIIKYWSS